MSKVKFNGVEFEFSDSEVAAIISESCGFLEPGIQKVIEVDPRKINMSLFEEEREDEEQEKLRQFIRKYIHWRDYNSKPFKYIIPEEKPYKTGWVHNEIRIETVAYPVERNKFFVLSTEQHQAICWAYQISTGETWEKICNELDEIKNPRIIRFRHGYAMVGGKKETASYVRTNREDQGLSAGLLIQYDGAVPAVIRYENCEK